MPSQAYDRQRAQAQVAESAAQRALLEFGSNQALLERLGLLRSQETEQAEAAEEDQQEAAELGAQEEGADSGAQAAGWSLDLDGFLDLLGSEDGLAQLEIPQGLGWEENEEEDRSCEPSTQGEEAGEQDDELADGLLEDLEKALAAGELPSVEELGELIHAASTEERMYALQQADPEQLFAGYAEDQRAALGAALLEGSLTWQMPRSGGSDFYEFFFVNQGQGELPAFESMNCWELLLYSAFLVGAVSAAWIVNTYASMVEPDSGRALVLAWSVLGFDASVPVDREAGQLPAAGQFVFFVQGGEPVHVALSLGGEQAMSLWRTPARSVARVGLFDLHADERRFGDAIW